MSETYRVTVELDRGDGHVEAYTGVLGALNLQVVPVQQQYSGYDMMGRMEFTKETTAQITVLRWEKAYSYDR